MPTAISTITALADTTGTATLMENFHTNTWLDLSASDFSDLLCGVQVHDTNGSHRPAPIPDAVEDLSLALARFPRYGQDHSLRLYPVTPIEPDPDTDPSTMERLVDYDYVIDSSSSPFLAHWEASYERVFITYSTAGIVSADGGIDSTWALGGIPLDAAALALLTPYLVAAPTAVKWGQSRFWYGVTEEGLTRFDLNWHPGRLIGVHNPLNVQARRGFGAVANRMIAGSNAAGVVSPIYLPDGSIRWASRSGMAGGGRPLMHGISSAYGGTGMYLSYGAAHDPGVVTADMRASYLDAYNNVHFVTSDQGPQLLTMIGSNSNGSYVQDEYHHLAARTWTFTTPADARYMGGMTYQYTISPGTQTSTSTMPAYSYDAWGLQSPTAVRYCLDPSTPIPGLLAKPST